MASFFKTLIGIEDNDTEEEYTQDDVEQQIKELEKEDKKKEYSRESRASREPIETKPQSFESSFKDFAGTQTKPVSSLASITSTGTFKLVLIEPKSFDECPKLVDYLKGRRPIIINLENIETETAKKIFDFISGATYALNGTVQKVSNNIFIFAPESVDVAKAEEKGYSFDKNQNQWER